MANLPTMKDTDRRVYALNLTDAKGHAVAPDATPAWSKDNDGGSLDVAEDGLGATLRPGALVDVSVTVKVAFTYQGAPFELVDTVGVTTGALTIETLDATNEDDAAPAA